MPLAAIVDDSTWYYLEGYEKRGTVQVKIVTKGPFKGQPSDAREVVTQTATERPMLSLVLYRWLPGEMRWQRTAS